MELADTVRSTGAHHAVDNSDWLKTIAIILVVVDHFGYFFMDDPGWWSAFGRMAAPVFFFLMGYAESRIVPFRWLWLGAILTLLDSWNNDWSWMAPNILFSLVFIRIARPYVKTLIQRYSWVAFALLVCALFVMLPIAANIVDYGAEGWLWALFGLCQRLYVDGRSVTSAGDTAESLVAPAYGSIVTTNLVRLLACIIAAVVYIWQEQEVFLFPQFQLAIVILGVGILSSGLCLFSRGPSRIQPPEPMVGFLRFTGRHTLEIYAIQLAGSELTIRLLPGLAP